MQKSKKSKNKDEAIRSQCLGKFCHENVDDAWEEADKLNDEKGLLCSVYKCPWCRYYHVGTMRGVRKRK